MAETRCTGCNPVVHSAIAVRGTEGGTTAMGTYYFTLAVKAAAIGAEVAGSIYLRYIVFVAL